jgi:hypothetical protein
MGIMMFSCILKAQDPLPTERIYFTWSDVLLQWEDQQRTSFFYDDLGREAGYDNYRRINNKLQIVGKRRTNLDSQGRTLYSKRENWSMQPYEKTETWEDNYEYGEGGISYERHRFTSLQYWDEVIYEYVYDEQLRLSELKYSREDSNEDSFWNIRNYTYDDSGNLVFVQSIDNDGRGYQSREYYDDDNCNYASVTRVKQSFGGLYEPADSTLTVVDDNCIPKYRDRYAGNEQGEWELTESYRFTYSFDETGNRTYYLQEIKIPGSDWQFSFEEINVYDDNSNIIFESNSYPEFAWRATRTFDDNNRLEYLFVEERQDGTFIPAYLSTISYNINGNVISWQNMYNWNSAENTFETITSEENSYDGDGFLVKTYYLHIL